MSGVIFYFFLGNIFYAAIALFTLDYVSDAALSSLPIKTNSFHFQLITSQANIMNIVVVFLIVISSAVLMYSFAVFATNITTNLIKIGDISYESKWYIHPKFKHVYLLLLIQNTQRSHYFQGYGIIHCRMETFTKVSTTILEIFLNC